LDNELTFLTCGSDATLLYRFRKNVEDVGLNRTVPFYLLEDSHTRHCSLITLYGFFENCREVWGEEMGHDTMHETISDPIWMKRDIMS
jgi:hypothetical protein